MKLTTMKEKEEKDLAQCSAEIKELERQVTHEQRLKYFMTTKSNEGTRLDNSLSHRHGESSRNIASLVKDGGKGYQKTLISHSRISH